MAKGAGSYLGQGGGQSRERGILGAGGELRAAGQIAGRGANRGQLGSNHAIKGILLCSVIIFC